jgi:hypothetical protein
MELKSLNEKLYDDFFVQELDSRLETDPLMIGGLVDLFDSHDLLQPVSCDVYCGEKAGCYPECYNYDS